MAWRQVTAEWNKLAWLLKWGKGYSADVFVQCLLSILK